ncbi:MAG: DUF6448 family protein [Acidobacteriota bacterium]|nr:DUF6448 family protein [Acidobacteriota bacterium]
MRKAHLPRQLITGLAIAIGLTPLASAPVLAHCDTVDGPVVIAAREALAHGDVTPVLKWVSPGDEEEVEAVFEHALAVRQLGDPARQLADRYFFETLVRLHREGEGFGYTGLKAAGSPVSAAVLAADTALESGSADALVAEITGVIAEGVRKRFGHARETRALAEESVTAGREFVAAYVQFTHYVEGLEAVAGGHSAEHGAGVPHGAVGPDR